MLPIVFFSTTIASDWTQTINWTALILSIGGLVFAIFLVLVLPLILTLAGFRDAAARRRDAAARRRDAELPDKTPKPAPIASTPAPRSAPVRNRSVASERPTPERKASTPEMHSSPTPASVPEEKKPARKAAKKTARKSAKKAATKNTPVKVTGEKPKKKTAEKANEEKPKKKTTKVAKKTASNGKTGSAAPKGAEIDPALGLIYKKKPKNIDDLKEISGVGPVLEGKLHKTGVYTFSQVSKWSDKMAREFGERLSFRDRVFRDEWRKQAAKLQKKKYGKSS